MNPGYNKVMKIKSLILAGVFMAIASTSAFADFGVGGQIGFTAGPYYSNFMSATIRSDENPWCLSVDAWPFGNTAAVTADNWFIVKPLSNPVSWYAFWGISANVGWNDFMVGTGARIGAGLDWCILDKRQVELFCQACWNPYVALRHGGDWDCILRPLNFPLSTGARYWFR